MNTIIILMPLFLVITSCQSNSEKTFKIQEGDLLFQDSDCGAFCEAIKKVTFGYEGVDYSHVGLVKKDQSQNWVVLEAVSKGVVETPLDEFLQRNLDDQNQPRVSVGRLSSDYQHLFPAAIQYGEKYLGKPYDQIFDINNDAYYCSELVYLLFKEANGGKDVFDLEPMTFVDPDTRNTFPVWEDYYQQLGVAIPENKPGLNPGSISRSEKLTIYYPYSQFSNIRHPED